MDTVKRLAFVVVAVALLVGCAHPKAVFPPETVDTATREEYAVYSAVLSQYPISSWVWDKYGEIDPRTILCVPVVSSYAFTGKEKIAIGSETISQGRERPPPWVRKQLHLDDGAMENLARRNRSISVLKPWFGIKARVLLLKWTGEFQRFRDRNPNAGVIGLSRVGFNSDYSKGLVQFEWDQGSDGARGFLIILSKKDGKWVVDSKLITGATEGDAHFAPISK